MKRCVSVYPVLAALSFLGLFSLLSCAESAPENPAADGAPEISSSQVKEKEDVAASGIPGETSIRSRTKRSIDRGLSSLRDAQAADGTWQIQGKSDPGVTSIALSAFLSSPRKYTSEDGPFIRKPLEYVASMAKEDGGIYDRGLANYVTCVSVMALIDSGEERFKPVVDSAQSFLRVLQADGGEGYSESDKYFGGTGYGGDERPDLSNASLWFDAMKATGAPSGDEAYKKALVFLNRCQNRSESNSEEWKDPRSGKVFIAGDDGGAMYSPGNSPAGEDEAEDGKRIPRSYGSMTYALLKCYLITGLPKDDPRVKSLVTWIANHYTLDLNPGFQTSDEGQQGLYYYYLNMARALEVYGEEYVVDAEGKKHPWREELSEHLMSLQAEDGSWVNQNTRWWEGLPVLATSYAVLALNVCYEGLE